MRKRILRIISIGSWLLFFSFSLNTRLEALSALAPNADRVNITRDTWGIPHIFAETDEGALFGLGWVGAEDRLFQMEYSRRVIQGRLSEMLGNIGSRDFTTMDSDIKNRHQQFYRHCQKLADNLDGETHGLLDAYCSGVNTYVQSHCSSLHDLFSVYNVVPEPWTPADCLACWMRIASFFSPDWTGKAKLLHDYEDLILQGRSQEEAVSKLSQGRVIDEAAAVVLEEDFDPALKAEIEAYAASLGYSNSKENTRVLSFYESPSQPSFSHAWVVGGSRTTTGAAVLNSDPQTTVRNPSVWYEFHVSGRSFNVRGIGIAGCPGLLIGWNEDVAWGVTALGADINDIFRLSMRRGGADAYIYDGTERTIESRQETVNIKGAASRQITVRSCHLGPVVSDLVVHRLRGEEYVLKTPELAIENRHTIQALFQMMRARDVNEFSEALSGWISPGVNVLFGDRQGNIAYWAKVAFPLRSPQSPFGGRAAQDGSSSRYGWVDIIPHRYLPHVINPSSGVLFSGNHLPVGSWYPLPMFIGTGGSGDSQRSWRLRKLLEIKKKFTPEDMLSVHFDDVNQAILSIFKAGYHARNCGQSLSSDSLKLLDLLSDWYIRGAHCDSHDPYFAAAFHINRGFRSDRAGALQDLYGGGDAGLCYFLKTLIGKVDSNPLYELDDNELNYVNSALLSGWNTAVSKYGRDFVQWKSGFQAGAARLGFPYFTNLEGFQSLDSSRDFMSEVLSDPEGATIWSQKGNSYSQWVDLANVDRSLAVLPPGISEEPSSPFYLKEKSLWESGMLRSSPLSKKSVEALASSTIRLIYPPGKKAYIPR